MDQENKTPSTTQMQAPPAKTVKMIKIRALKPIAPKGGELVEVGQVIEVDEETAKEFADKVFTGNYSFSGERASSTADRHLLKRAERVA